MEPAIASTLLSFGLQQGANAIGGGPGGAPAQPQISQGQPAVGADAASQQLMQAVAQQQQQPSINQQRLMQMIQQLSQQQPPGGIR